MVIGALFLPFLLFSCMSTPVVCDSTKLINEGKITLEDGYKLVVSQLYVLQQSEKSVKLKDLSEKDNLFKLYKMKFSNSGSLNENSKNLTLNKETKKIEQKSKDFYLRRKNK